MRVKRRERWKGYGREEVGRDDKGKVEYEMSGCEIVYKCEYGDVGFESKFLVYNETGVLRPGVGYDNM